MKALHLNNKAIKILSLDSTWFRIIELYRRAKRWQNSLELVYTNDYILGNI